MDLKALQFSILAGAALLASPALAQDQELAKQLSNPVASLISLPFQFNYDSGYGPSDGEKYVLNVQPVVPITLNDDWNVISRTIIPIVKQSDIAGESGSQSGVGDVLASFFFSPKLPTKNGLIWGAGPAFLLPTASDELLGAEKWGIGPTAVVLKQHGGWTFGGLANHIWSVAGEDDRDDISSTFLQPFVTYTTPTSWTFALNTESTYDWKNEQWTVPINMQVSKLVKFGAQPVSFQMGARYWADAPENGPDDWGMRASVTWLYPKG
ncbi:transporter [Paracoccus aestuariivivens]|uniref:Transporter n=1 Tax=Paracoccus aestuariivivens TaxID=1820333 RepID=A0A6L6JAD7_9RHOB|nr:transporter [Paracoccus aestuariivivens]MTH77094.1 transporter [Paracoccus aestuariivivens]